MFKKIIKKIIVYVFGSGPYFKFRWFIKHGPQYFPIACYWNIDGWLYEKEAITLYNIALNLPDNNPVVVEIGSWLGKSSVIIAKGIRKKKDPILYCIDPFNASGDVLGKQDYDKRAKKLEGTLKGTFIKNMKKCKVHNYIKILEGMSYDFVDEWKQKIDFLFIDASHSYEDTLRDFVSWSKFIRPGGYIAFHDVIIDSAKMEIYHGGPHRVVKEHILDNNKWTEKKFANSLFSAKKV
jgi:predicted O-methyltransferase YrrM